MAGLENVKSRKPTVLMVDDEESFHDIVEPYLTDYRTLKAYNGWQTLSALDAHHVDVVLLDLVLPDTEGLHLLDQIHTDRDDIEVIVVTAQAEIRLAVEAVKSGAFDFLVKSYENYQQLSKHIERALLHRRRRRERIEARTKEQWMRDAFATLEDSRAPSVKPIIRLARQVADKPLTVLLTGESGVGKELMAHYIHTYSPRANSPFVAINLAAIPDTLLESNLFGHVKGAFTGADREQLGKFELADGGTLFLDEIGELDSNVQVKLLRVLQEREVERLGAREPSPIDVRVIAATNKNLEHEVRAGRFREDLYYRLNVIRVKIPPLRERTLDLPALIKLLCTRHAATMGHEPPTFTREALVILCNYGWPGNIRELENLVMRLVALAPGRRISPNDIPVEYLLPTLNYMSEQSGRQGQRKDEKKGVYFRARDQFERYLVHLTVNRLGGDKDAAARELGVSRSTIKNKLRGDDPDWTGALSRAGIAFAPPAGSNDDSDSSN
ncbi:MAG: sigma-54 dependent transcriptional regulator [Proteobacteria bacterium]|nr:sigma-54 dependent transcriptional regulator [Pseudomonadota bacterium]